MARFGSENSENIKIEVANLTPQNTKRSKLSAWRQFLDFCKERSYNVEDPASSITTLASILEDYAFNMKKKNSEDYKESVIKVMWNSTAKQLQHFFFENYQIKFDPFNDVEFKGARAARDAKRRQLQSDPEKRKRSAAALTSQDYEQIIKIWDEDTPNGLQKKFFYIASHELAWRGGEGAAAKVEYFAKEFNNKNNFTGRIEYNPIFTKTTQGGARKLSDSKWLIENRQNPDVCPVRLFHKLTEIRGNSITIDRLFLTPNPKWNSSNWFKNCPVGKNTMSTWFKEAAFKVGIDTKKVKITNHSARATAVSNLAKKGVSEQQLIKITGHSNSQSIKPYLQMDKEHHHDIINAMRGENKSVEKGNQSAALASCIGLEPELHKQISNNNNSNSQATIVYNNCVFNVTNNY